MNGVHDLGGQPGFGPVDRQEPPRSLSERWEAAVFAIVNAALAKGWVRNADQFRHGIERIEPRAYLTHTYYGRWLAGLETLLVEGGHIDRAALDARFQALGGVPDALVGARPSPNPDRVDYPPADFNSARPLDRPCPFAVGDRVRTRSSGVDGHTRLPGYAQGKTGRVVAVHGGWVFPDDNAHGRGENPQHLLTVQFAGEQLWGASSEAGVTVNIDLFESYLSAAD